MTIPFTVMTQLASFVALLLIASALHKWLGRRRAERAVHELTGVPLRYAGLALNAACFAEILAGALLCVPTARTAGAVLATLIWSSYFAFMLRAHRTGSRDLDCGCSFGSLQHPLGAFQLFRTLVLAGLAFSIALMAGSTPGAGADGASPAAIATQILSGTALLALYAALDQVMALRPLRTGAVP